MRGKGDDFEEVSIHAGITPAYAGKRSTRRNPGKKGEDHPRVCGEKRAPAALSLSLSGSPPRMRGKEYERGGSDSRSRITPAYAGKSAGSVFPQIPQRDHPRVCGEKCRICVSTNSAAGSPPRMRGKGIRQVALWAVSRITPAYAGKSLTHSAPPALSWDHPRVCGEKYSVDKVRRLW